jgi:hypothetical protein
MASFNYMQLCILYNYLGKEYLAYGSTFLLRKGVYCAVRPSHGVDSEVTRKDRLEFRAVVKKHRTSFHVLMSIKYISY